MLNHFLALRDKSDRAFPDPVQPLRVRRSARAIRSESILIRFVPSACPFSMTLDSIA
jgi:hypothetical protein